MKTAVRLATALTLAATFALTVASFAHAHRTTAPAPQSGPPGSTLPCPPCSPSSN